MDADDFNGLVQDYLAGVDNLDEIVEALLGISNEGYLEGQLEKLTGSDERILKLRGAIQNRLSDIRKKIAEKKAEEKTEAERLQALNQRVLDGLKVSPTGRIKKQRAATEAKKKAASTSKPILPKSKK